MFSCGLVHCGTPSWFINRGEYGKNTRVFFTIVEKDFLNNEITVQKKNLLCKTESCNLCINNKYATNEVKGPLIGLRNSKKVMQRLMIIIQQENLI